MKKLDLKKNVIRSLVVKSGVKAGVRCHVSS